MIEANDFSIDRQYPYYMSLHNPPSSVTRGASHDFSFVFLILLPKEINKSGSIGMTKEGQKLYFNDTRGPDSFL